MVDDLLQLSNLQRLARQKIVEMEVRVVAMPSGNNRYAYHLLRLCYACHITSRFMLCYICLL